MTRVNTIGESLWLANESRVVDVGQAAVFLNVSCLSEPFILLQLDSLVQIQSIRHAFQHFSPVLLSFFRPCSPCKKMLLLL